MEGKDGKTVYPCVRAKHKRRRVQSDLADVDFVINGKQDDQTVPEGMDMETIDAGEAEGIVGEQEEEGIENFQSCISDFGFLFDPMLDPLVDDD